MVLDSDQYLGLLIPRGTNSGPGPTASDAGTCKWDQELFFLVSNGCQQDAKFLVEI
jgi:hypothetical protein